MFFFCLQPRTTQISTFPKLWFVAHLCDRAFEGPKMVLNRCSVPGASPARKGPWSNPPPPPPSLPGGQGWRGRGCGPLETPPPIEGWGRGEVIPPPSCDSFHLLTVPGRRSLTDGTGACHYLNLGANPFNLLSHH